MNLKRFGRFLRPGTALAIAVAAAIVAGCGDERPAALVASAESYMAKNDYKAAEIQLKNALQKEPRDGRTRFLLGVSLNRTGDAVSAEKELRRALEYGYPPEQVYPELALALERQGDPKKLVADLADKTAPDAAGQAALKSILGDAYVSLEQLKAAKAAYAAALAASPGYPRARVGEARLAALGRDLDGAMKINDEVLREHPGQPDALALKVDLLLAAGRTDAALEVLGELVKAQPTSVQARFALISLLVRESKYDQAAAELQALKKVAPSDARTNYLEALIAFRKGDVAKARDAVQQVLKVAPDNSMVQQLAAAIEYQLGSVSTAEDLLRKVVARSPQSLYARNLLVATLLRTGQAAKAEEVLNQTLALAPADPTVLRLAGEVAFANGDLAKATAYYDQAASADKGNAVVRTRLGQLRLASGDADRAMRDFEAAALMDTSQSQADIALIATHLRLGDYRKALAAVDALEKKQRDSAVPWNLRGVVQAAKGDTEAARASFSKALEIQPTFVVAARNLARQDVAAKNPAAAKKRMEEILSKEPANEQALLTLAEIEAATGGSKESVATVLKGGVRANPASPALRLALINVYNQANDRKEALAAAAAAVSALPTNPQLLETLGLLQQAYGDTGAAIETFAKLVTQVPQSPSPLLRLAAAQFAAKDYDSAIASLRKADQLRPDSIEARRQIVAVQLASGRTQDALNEARTVQKARPEEAAGYALEGDVMAAQKQFGQAADAYRQAMRLQPAAPYVVRLHAMLNEAGKASEGDAVAAQWIRENPKDVFVRMYLADLELRDKDYRGAAKLYKEVTEVQPSNALAMNNLAWALNELKDPAALAAAERALSLAPNNPAVADTLGWVLFTRGETKRGIELLRKASAAAPGAAEIRVHLAKALIKTGDSAGARKELDAVVAMGEGNPARSEAEALLKGL
jgi:putative PEP-CTERM system TPR-repeat lipoprotein